jgi:hypothetical protein
MDFATENQPETCSSLGLDCGTCIERCASTTAAICPSLQPGGVHRMFFQLYPSQGCQPMAHAFMRAYHDAAMASRPMVIAARAGAAAAA